MADDTLLVNNLFDEDVTIDNETFPWVSAISIKAKFNAARQVTIQFSTREGLEMCSVGRTLRVQIGKSDIAKGIDFVGKIKTVVPGYDISTATAFDYIADLNSSVMFNFKDIDYAGMDMIQAAKAGLNNTMDDSIYEVDAHTRIDLKGLNTQCGVKYKSDQGFEGYQTRKSFLDKIFNETYSSKPSDLYLSGAYPPLTFLRWYYFIRDNNILEVIQPDIYTSVPVASLGRNNFNIVGNGLNATIDTARMINSIVITSNNTDYVATYLDTSSINQYGSQSALLTVKTSDVSAMDELAYNIVNSNNKPAGAYSLTVNNAHWIDLGDIVEVSIPTLEDNKRFIVKEYTTTLKDTISTQLTLGLGKISTAELVKRVSNQ